MAQKSLITNEKLNELQKELHELLYIKRPAVIEAIQIARENGDLSENADYHAAKEEQGLIEARIAEVVEYLNNYEIISDSKTDIVGVGSKIKYEKNGKEYECTIVGEIESDIFSDKISNVSPFAIALLGHKAGEEVAILGIEKPYKVKIKSIS
ncbi:MAG: transcription elongation factor GreA [Mycoplasmataceae bacterium]|jgi:transcription elongation factor GreA|nr:transcription elongation factor GreA [Mycoplasmataceae bacterium]